MIRVVRCDTGREHEIPETALRWGPDTRQGTCRAQLLRLCRVELTAGDVPYVLPFEGAKWAVRVMLAEGPEVRAKRVQAAHFQMLRGVIPAARVSRDIDRLGSLLKAAGDALQAETVEDALPHLHAGLRHFGEQDPQAGEDKPDALGEALELLANALSWVPRDQVPRLWGRIRDFLEQETSAEIRRAWRGGVRG